jgi:hypothetical protein
MSGAMMRQVIAVGGGVLLGGLSSYPFLKPCSDGSLCGPLVYLALPGILISSGVHGNVHAFWMPLAVFFNGLLYAVLLWILLKLLWRTRES